MICLFPVILKVELLVHSQPAISSLSGCSHRQLVEVESRQQTVCEGVPIWRGMVQYWSLQLPNWTRPSESRRGIVHLQSEVPTVCSGLIQCEAISDRAIKRGIAQQRIIALMSCQNINLYIINTMQSEDKGLEQQLLHHKKLSTKSSHSSLASQRSDKVEPSLNFFPQAALLIHKNLILTFKNPKNLIFLLLTPFLLSGFLFLFQDLARDNGKRVRLDTQTMPIDSFPRCYGADCISLDYRVISGSQGSVVPDWVNYTVDYIRLQTGLGVGEVSMGPRVVTNSSLQEYYDYHVANPNITQIGLLFCDGISNDFWLNMFYCNGSADYSYYLVMNKSDNLSVIFHDILEPLPVDPVASALKLLVDNAILSYIRNPDITNRVKQIHYTHTQFPVGENKYIDNYDIVTTIGAFYYMITPLFAFLFIQNEIVREKQYKLRQGLNIFGASHGAYWFSWFVVSNIYALIASVSTYAAGTAFGFGFFRDTPFYIVIFFLLFPFTLAMQMLAYFLSTLTPNLKSSNTVSYAIMLFAIVVQSFTSDNMLLTFLFTQDAGSIVQFLKIFFCFYPPFSYTKIFTNITQYSGFHFSFVERRWVESTIKYDLSIFAKNIESPLPFGGSLYYRYSDLYSMLILYGDVIFFLILTWYFDHIIASNRGRGQPFYYPLNKLIQRFNKHRKPNRLQQEDNPEISGFSIQNEEQSARKQRNKVYSHSKQKIPVNGMRIKNLSKTFSRLFSNSHRVEALKNFNLQIEGNELMGILGHNGAGKTTLINILTGVITPDESQGLEIIVGNTPISNINQIRKHIGVCSQFDILWNQLTAEEHLILFGKLKGIQSSELNAKIDETLTFVNLLPDKKNRVGRFSGGMKRRLSLAIAAIGNPKIILLDQPTTGLDPKVRQQVWKLIQKLKEGKSIILTTHSMQEADVLADRICVIAKGKLKCIGTTFNLKETYGEGHRLLINLKSQEHQQTVVTKIQKLFPKIRLVDCRGGSLIMGVTDYEDLLHLVTKLQNKDSLGLDEYEIKKCIKGWSVSHSTLEEVFMKVSKQKEE